MRRRRRSRSSGPTGAPRPEEFQRALELINAAERPLILAGHGIMLSGAMDIVRAFAEKANIPVSPTLLGIGGFPASHPLNLGMMGMHGEAWVNSAIQQADLLLAFGMRFDDRVTGNLKTYALNAKKIHIDIDAAEINKNVRVEVGIVGDLKESLEALMPGLKAGDRSEVDRAHRGAQRRFGGARHSEPARQRPSVCRARHQRFLARRPRATPSS